MPHTRRQAIALALVLLTGTARAHAAHASEAPAAWNVLAGLGPGQHRIALPELANAAPGIRSVRLQAGAATLTRRVALLR